MNAAAAIRSGAAAAVVRPCPQCGGDSVKALPRYSTDEWHVVRCAACGFVFLRNALAYKSLETDFAWEKTFAEEAERRVAARPAVMWLDDKTHWRLHLFRRSRADLYRQLFKPGRVLDVGCAAGTGVPEPFIPFGIEISRALYQKAVVNMAARGGRVVQGPAAEAIRAFPNDFFTGVILSSVVEHETQPKVLLHQVARVLKGDGAAYIRVPNFGSINRAINGGAWCGIRHPDHVNYFTVASLRRMARDAGLALRLLHPVRLPVDDNINAVLTKAPAR